MDDIFNEVAQDVQKEKFLKFWNANKKLIINVVTVVLVLGAGFGVYTTMNQKAQEKDSIDFLHALHMANEGKEAEALTHFENIAENGTSGYALLAKLKKAALKAKEDKAAGLALYKEMAENKKIDNMFQSYAQIMVLGLQLDTMDPVQLEKELEVLTTETNPFRFIALEYAAIAAQRQNKSEAVHAYLMKIVDDADAPNGIRKRAGELVTLFDKK